MKKFCIILTSIIILLVLIGLCIVSNKKNNNIADNQIITQEGVSEKIYYPEHSYKNPYLPEGFHKVETESASWSLDENGDTLGWNNGLVIEDEEGNQFVWIPVKDVNKLEKKEGFYQGEEQKFLENIKEADDIDGTGESKDLYNSIRKYSGFYIARYEAGVEDVLDKYKMDGSIRPLSKKGVYVWNSIPWGSEYDYALDGVQGSDTAPGAVKVARSMYPNINKIDTYNLQKDAKNETGVVSTLCYGIQWDLTMQFIDDVQNPYTNTRYIEDSRGMGWYKYELNSEIKTGKDIDSSKSNCVKNIYDLAGNANEWTMESFKDSFRICRGGTFGMGDENISASTRTYIKPAIAVGYDYHIGFRVALYIK